MTDIPAETVTAPTPPPPTALFPWLPLVLGAVGVLYGMIGFWIRGYDNYDRACILLASAYLVHSRFPKLIRRSDTPWPLLGLVLIIVGGLAFLPPWFVYSQIGPRPVILWWEALSLFVTTAGMVLLRSGPRLLYDVRFMMIFPLFALPLPGRVQQPLNRQMQAISADMGAAILPVIGVPVLAKNANHIQLRNGGIEVAEVCSGLVMIRTTLSLSALLAHLYGFGAFRSVILMAMAIPIIIIVNAFRVTAFGYLQDGGYTDWVMAGWRHEMVGYIAFIPGLFIVIGIVNWLRPKAPLEGIVTSLPAVPSRLYTRIATVFLVIIAIAGTLINFAPGIGKSVGGNLSFESFPLTLGKWQHLSSTADSPEAQEAFKNHLDSIRGILTTNSELNRTYYSKGGDRAELWLFYWQSSMVVKDYHHPDTCNQLQGFTTLSRSIEPVITPGGRRIPLTYRKIERDGNQMIIVYWTQEGRRLWTDREEAIAKSFFFPLVWTTERLQQGRRDDDSDDRLQAYMSLPLMKHRSEEVQKAALFELAALVADEMYKLCPWADPGIAK
ncbi:hypothetical protein BH11PLA2_BH11PLA2_41230 [soil metagenome]